MKKDAFKKDLTAMFNNMAKKKAKALAEAKGKPAEDLKPEFHHKYFATYRRAGHQTVRFYTLGKGGVGLASARIFNEVAKPQCDHLNFYRVHAVTGAVETFDPEAKQKGTTTV